MIETIQGDVFDLAREMKGFAVVGTNTTTSKKGEAVMGRGAAKQAAELYPYLPKYFGDYLSGFAAEKTEKGTIHPSCIGIYDVFTYQEMVCEKMIFGFYAFIVKRGWWEDASYNIIKKSSEMLAEFICNGYYYDKYENSPEPFLVTKVGCGNGRLQWDKVKPILEEYLEEVNYDNNIYFVEPIGG
ncbi:MAG: hypothetical protein WC476_01435 [Phycisphaerae bacterium]